LGVQAGGQDDVPQAARVEGPQILVGEIQREIAAQLVEKADELATGHPGQGAGGGLAGLGRGVRQVHFSFLRWTYRPAGRATWTETGGPASALCT